MKIIISPAKKMNVRENELEPAGLPCYIKEAGELMEYIRGLSRQEAQALWKCNDSIADLNYRRFREMDLKHRLTAAILSYEGIQYQYMAPSVFQTDQLNYVQKHLRILSGLYGILRPLDGIVPYRLEMQTKISYSRSGQTFDELYSFWGDRIYKELVTDSRLVVNLASKEYSKTVEAWLEPDVVMINVIFGCMETDKTGNTGIKVKGTEAKIARGEMVRYMAEHTVEDPQDIKQFRRLDYQYSTELSDETTYVFIKKK